MQVDSYLRHVFLPFYSTHKKMQAHKKLNFDDKYIEKLWKWITIILRLI